MRPLEHFLLALLMEIFDRELAVRDGDQWKLVLLLLLFVFH
jgi:hypothetical protein